jgi:triosephosphate isomerase
MIIKQQLDSIKDHVTDWGKIVIVYEPVWAIDSATNVSADVAEGCCQQIRNYISENVSPDVSQSVRIQYGGPVNAAKAAELIACENIDGFLVSDESLTDEFV